MAVRKHQEDHETLVRSLAVHLKKDGHTDIKVDLFGNNRPDQIRWESKKTWFIPDVTSTKDKKYIFEVETEDSIDEAHTEDEWRLFAATALNELKLFIVVVPKGSEHKAWQRAEALGVTLYNVWAVE
jgi:hypothetical protein